MARDKSTWKRKRTIIKWSGVVLLFFVLLLVCPAEAYADDSIYQCGGNVYAKLEAGGVLTIYGTGNMWDYPSSMDELPITAERIEKVIIQDGVTSIGAYAFYKRGSVNSVTIGKDVKTIGAFAFSETGIRTIDIPGNVEKISGGAFYGSVLEDCTFHEGLQEIGEEAFRDTNLTKVVIPNGVKAIRSSAFYDYAGELIIPERVGVIEEVAFGPVKATIYSRTVAIEDWGLEPGASTSIIARKGSTAEQYALAHGNSLQYFKCDPSEGLPALEHSYDEGQITKAATCKAKGVKTFTCAKCGEKKTEEIPLGGHTYGKWTVTTSPTVLKAGKKSRKCSVCGKKETSSVAKLKPSITLNVKSLTILVGQSSQGIKVTSKGKGDSISSWQSSNKKIVTVNSKGKITGKKAGTANIKVKLKSGISKSVKVTVKKRVAATKLKVTAKGATMKSSKITLKKGKKCTLAAQVSPKNTTDKVTYSSSKKSVATVSGKGVVTAKKAGTAQITVKAGSKRVVIRVTVKK